MLWVMIDEEQICLMHHSIGQTGIRYQQYRVIAAIELNLLSHLHIENRGCRFIRRYYFWPVLEFWQNAHEVERELPLFKVEAMQELEAKLLVEWHRQSRIFDSKHGLLQGKPQRVVGSFERRHR